MTIVATAGASAASAGPDTIRGGYFPVRFSQADACRQWLLPKARAMQEPELHREGEAQSVLRSARTGIPMGAAATCCTESEEWRLRAKRCDGTRASVRIAARLRGQASGRTRFCLSLQTAGSHVGGHGSQIEDTKTSEAQTVQACFELGSFHCRNWRSSERR